MKKFLYRILCGFFLGLSVFAPGFSGSVVAIIMGIYQDLIRIVSNPFKKLKENIIFCLPLIIGAIISGVLFVIAFKFLFETYEKATYLLFVGLIAGSLPVIFKDVKKEKFQKRNLIGGFLAFSLIVTLCIFIMGVGMVSGTEITVSLPLLSISGILAGASLLIPGMSNATVLLIMGVYSQLILIAESILRMDFTYLAYFGVFVVCAIIGLVISSRFIKFAFEKFTSLANSIVLGFMAGSLIGILIQSLHLDSINFNWLLGSIMIIVGICISFGLITMGKTINKE